MVLCNAARASAFQEFFCRNVRGTVAFCAFAATGITKVCLDTVFGRSKALLAELASSVNGMLLLAGGFSAALCLRVNVLKRMVFVPEVAYYVGRPIFRGGV